MRKSRIVLAALAALAIGVLFATYGTVLPSAPLATIALDGPTVVDSDGEFTAVVDTESRRALIINADGDLTGVTSCTTTDSPIDAITDACVSNGTVYLSGVRFEPDSDIIVQERVVAYDKGGNYRGIIFEIAGADSVIPTIKSISDSTDSVVVAYETRNSLDGAKASEQDSAAEVTVTFVPFGEGETLEPKTINAGSMEVHDAAYSGAESAHYATLSIRGILNDGASDLSSEVHAGHAFAAIDLDSDGNLYACDDISGALCVIPRNSSSTNTLAVGSGFDNVHENSGVISVCDIESNKVVLYDDPGSIQSEFTAVKPSLGFSLRMIIVWASGLYLVALITIYAVRKARRLLKMGKTESIGPMVAAVAVVAAIAVAIGSLSFASYQKSLDLRAREINMCADYLETHAPQLTEAMEKANDRSAIRGDDDEFIDAIVNLIEAARPALMLVDSANSNNIGMYCTLYGSDDSGIFYLYGSSAEHVMGTSARMTNVEELQDAFKGEHETKTGLHEGRTLRDATQYRLVQIPDSSGKGTIGVIEIGSKMRSFESSLTGDLAQRILALLVMVLVVYLAYSELRACGRCMLSFRQRQKEDGPRAVAMLTRPFTLAITMLASIDSVMTVLIARDLLGAGGMGDQSALLAVPAVMLGVGLIIGQALYGIAGSRVGLRKLATVGAGVMMACACFTGIAVASGIFWLYCVAKLVMSIPFGMLYTLGYSLPRLESDAKARAAATGGVKRTDTSAAALGTVLGGYAAQTLGNMWVYVIVAVACLPVILMAMNLLPRRMLPLEKLAQSHEPSGHVHNFLKTPVALGIALFIVLPATLAAGYASFLFPIFSADLGLSKANINNIFVLGQLIVFVIIDTIDRVEARQGKWKTSLVAIALLGAVFLLFAVNTTLVWSVAVIAIVAVLCKSADGWKAMWLKSASAAGVPAGRATGAMFAVRSLALIAQPFILGALLGATDSVAVIVIGLICVLCAGLFFAVTRRTSIAKDGGEADAQGADTKLATEDAHDLAPQPATEA